MTLTQLNLYSSFTDVDSNVYSNVALIDKDDNPTYYLLTADDFNIVSADEFIGNVVINSMTDSHKIICKSLCIIPNGTKNTATFRGYDYLDDLTYVVNFEYDSAPIGNRNYTITVNILDNTGTGVTASYSTPDIAADYIDAEWYF